MKNFTKQILAVLLFCLFGFSSYSQLSQGGTPYTKTHAVQAKAVLPIEILPKPIMADIVQTDLVNDALSKPYRVGINYPVNYNVVNSGTWETTSDGGSLWRLRISMEDAKAISINYHNFFIPDGGKVFLYNELENHVIGAFTSAYNYENQIRATQMIEGSTITIEYYAPAGVAETPIIELKEVVYYYRGVEEFIAPYMNKDANLVQEKAMSCEVDVACSESSGWGEQVDAVVHYVFSQGANSYVCSASMINNTAQDCTPYILTAWHCGEPDAGDNISTWTWYWNYQKTSCSTGNLNSSDPSKGSQSMTGGTVVASSGNGTLYNPPGTSQVAGSDFYLVELNSIPPASYNAFYAGWDRTENGSNSGVGIHHPAGSAKKISTYTTTLQDGNFNQAGATTHWSVLWAATTNGNGVTEGGSSGSPIFDSNGRIIGQLSGGGSACTVGGAGTGTGPTVRDVYGKMFYNWDQCGTAAAAQLAPWLDPTNSGVTYLDGAYEPCNASISPTCNINASSTSITVGGTVTFSDGSSGNPTSWSWNFDNTSQGGVTPSTANTQNPGTVTYSNVGTYEVELTATNANGSCTSTETITVAAFSGCDSIMNIVDTNSLGIYGTTSGFITGTNEYGDLAKAEKYSGYTGTHVTGSDMYFVGGQDGGNGATVDVTVWADNAGLPGAVLGTGSYSLSAIVSAMASNNNQGLFYLPLDQPALVNGNDFYIGVDFSSFGYGDSLGIFSKYASVSTPANSAYEQNSAGVWTDMSTAWGGGDWSMFMSAHITDSPVSGSAAVSSSTVCTGSPVDYSFTGSNVTGQTWYTAGTPATATTANVSVTYSTPGTYMAYLVLDGPCGGSYIDSVEVVVTDGPTVASSSTNPTCAGNDGTITLTATGGTAPYTYSIDGGTSFVSSNSFTGLSDGAYSIVTQDANGCQGTDAVTLTAGGAAIAVTTSDTDPSCGNADGQIAVSATGGTTPYTYSIDGGTTFVSSGTFTSLPVGSYDVVVEDANGCQGTVTTALSNTGGPSVAAIGTDVSCNGLGDGTITATGTGGTAPYTYSIDGTSFVSSNTFNSVSAGAYTVYIQDAGGCQSTSTVTIAEPTAITHTVSIVDASCGSSTGSISVAATGGQTPYTYSLDGTSQSNGTFSGLAGGSYTVQVTDANGCTSSMTTETVNGGTAPSITTSISGETCMNSNGEISISATGGTTPYSYSLNSGTSQSTGIFSGLSAGSYTIDVADANGCSANTTATVTNTGGFTLIVNPTSGQTVCEGNSANISASGAGTGASYQWDQGLGLGASHNVTPSVTTTYSVVATDGAGCSSTASTTITVETVPTVTVIPTNPSICSGEVVDLTATGASTYVWNTGTTDATISVSPTNQTTYTVIGQNGSCAGSAVQVVVGVNPSPTVNAGSDVINIPVGGTVNFNNSGSNATSYNWNFGDGQSSTTGFVAHTYNVQGTYTVVLTGTIGSCTATDVITINVGVTGVDQVTLENSVNVYPNPNAGLFNLKLEFAESQNVEITLFSAIGQLIEMRQLDNVNSQIETFNMSSEAEGVYFIRVKTKNGTVTKRMTITR